MTRYLITFLTFVIVLVGSFSLGSNRDFSYSKDTHSVITTLPSVDLGPLRVSGTKAGLDILFVNQDSLKIPLFKKVTYFFQQPFFYLSKYSLVALREFHLLI